MTQRARSPTRAGRTGVNFLLWATAALVILFLGVPLLALVWRAVGEADGFSAQARLTLRQAMVLSLVTSGLTLLLVIAVGTPLAYVLARRRFVGAGFVDTLVDLPMVLPPAVAGLALLMAFGRRGVFGDALGELGISLPFTTAAVVVAQLFVALPFYVRAGKSGFARVDQDLERAAAGLGATPARVFWTVTLPLARPGLLAGATLAWARALGEFGATIMFAGNYAGRTQTMPLAVYGRLEAGDLPTALLLALTLLGTTLLILLAFRLSAGAQRDRPVRSLAEQVAPLSDRSIPSGGVESPPLLGTGQR